MIVPNFQFLIPKTSEKAINLDDKYKEKAKTDSDFNNIRDSQEFKELIEG